MSEPVQQASSAIVEPMGNQEILHAQQDPYNFPIDEGFVEQKKPSKRASGMLVLLLGLMAIAGVVVITVTQKQFLTPKGSLSSSSSDSDDMGAGIAQASGLRGHLVTRWQQGKTQYMLKMEPLDPRDAAGFSAVAGNPSKPVSINIRLLDAAGFALCGKQILLHSGSQNGTQPGTDVFQNIQSQDGSVEALWAQGELPCSPDQYKKFDYWDLSTNFPTIAEQDASLGRKPAVAPVSGVGVGSPQTTASAAGSKGRRKPAVKGPVSMFYFEGDDEVSMYEPARAILSDDSGRSFFIPVKTDQVIAATWAANYSHIHFKCDQHANCALRTGNGEILGRMSN
jgi:hypothetical protein